MEKTHLCICQKGADIDKKVLQPCGLGVVVVFFANGTIDCGFEFPAGCKVLGICKHVCTHIAILFFSWSNSDCYNSVLYVGQAHHTSQKVYLEKKTFYNIDPWLEFVQRVSKWDEKCKKFRCKSALMFCSRMLL
jgi:hypothetical protein